MLVHGDFSTGADAWQRQIAGLTDRMLLVVDRPGYGSSASGLESFTIDGDADGVNSGTAHHAAMFTGPHQHRVFKGAGHNPPQERPAEWVEAVLDARAMASET